MVGKNRPKLNISLSSIKFGIKVGIHNPKALFNYVRYGLDNSVQCQVYDMVSAIGWDTWALSSYWHTIRSNLKFKYMVEDKLSGINYGQIIAPELLYVLVRKSCPKIVVETGVSSGVSSAYILQALEDNHYGKLYSIDYPNIGAIEGKPIPNGMNSGFAIPNYLRHRWVLQVGKTDELLAPLLKRLGGVDIFLHDSEHSYENMSYEYKTAWQYIRNYGLLLSHDINENNAFKEFSERNRKKKHEIYFTGMGLIRK